MYIGTRRTELSDGPSSQCAYTAATPAISVDRENGEEKITPPTEEDNNSNNNIIWYSVILIVRVHAGNSSCGRHNNVTVIFLRVGNFFRTRVTSKGRRPGRRRQLTLIIKWLVDSSIIIIIIITVVVLFAAVVAARPKDPKHVISHTLTYWDVGVSVPKVPTTHSDIIIIVVVVVSCTNAADTTTLIYYYIIYIRVYCALAANTCSGERVGIYRRVWETMRHTIIIFQSSSAHVSTNLRSRLVAKTPERDWDVTAPIISRFPPSEILTFAPVLNNDRRTVRCNILLYRVILWACSP